MAKELKLKVRKFWGLISTFVEVTGEKLVGGPFCPPPPILNRVNKYALIKIALINMVAISMMSAKMATLVLTKIKVF